MDMSSAPAAQNPKKAGTSSRTSPARSPRDSRTRSARGKSCSDGDNKVLAQQAKNDDDTFNFVLVNGTHFNDVDLSVRLQAVAGELDQGGGARLASLG